MLTGTAMVAAMVVSAALLCGCGGAVVSSTGGGCGASCSGDGGTTQVATPVITTAPAQNGALIVSITTATAGATIRYTLDGTTPDSSSPTTFVYQAPFLVASNLTVTAIATAPGDAASPINNPRFAPNIPSGTLVWGDDFSNPTGVPPALPGWQ